MKTYVILDSAIGRLQWTGEAESAGAAIRSYHAETGCIIAETAADLLMGQVSQDEQAAVLRWWHEGAPAGGFPNIMVTRIPADRVLAAVSE